MILAIDPGPEYSAYALVDPVDRKPVEVGKIPSKTLLGMIETGWPAPVSSAVVEMVASYGMAVGAEVFDTCVWIGRFVQSIRAAHRLDATLVTRLPVKLHHCHSAAAKDANVVQALIDRFAPGQQNHGKGTKKQPGWFFGFAADMWQAYALGVYWADTARPADAVASTI